MANEKRRLIDADAIYDAVERRYQVSSGIEHRCERDLLDLICSTDTVDAVEVVHGRWEQHDGISICPSCHSMFDVDLKMIQVPSTFEMPIHCPHCGAKMDGERREGE